MYLVSLDLLSFLPEIITDETSSSDLVKYGAKVKIDTIFNNKDTIYRGDCSAGPSGSRAPGSGTLLLAGNTF